MFPAEMPYFLSNEEWYYHDEIEFMYKLTEKAPPEAVQSYIEFYSDDDYYCGIGRKPKLEVPDGSVLFGDNKGHGGVNGN